MKYMPPVKISVIGVGYMGFLHAKKLAQLEGANLVGVWDTDTERANHVAKELGTKAFDSFDEAVGYSQAVVLATPSQTHGKIGMHIIQRARHILIEKPIAVSVEQAEVLIDLANEHNVFLMVGHIENFNPAFIEAKKYIKEPLFIEVHRLTSFRERGADVSVVEDLMIHDLEILARVCGTDVESIDISTASVITDSPDIANVRMKFENGTVANITASRLSLRAKRKMRIFQKNTYIGIDFGQRILEIAKLAEDDTEGEFVSIGEKKVELIHPEIQVIDQLEEELKCFINYIRTDTPPTATSALWALKMCRYIVGHSK